MKHLLQQIFGIPPSQSYIEYSTLFWTHSDECVSIAWTLVDHVIVANFPISVDVIELSRIHTFMHIDTTLQSNEIFPYGVNGCNFQLYLF